MTDVGSDPKSRGERHPFKDQVSAALAHELRDPLNSILTTLNCVRDRRVDEGTTRQALARAERQALHMSRIVENVLALCRADQGKLSLRTELVDVPAVIADSVGVVDPFFTTRRHRLTVSLPAEPVNLIADPSRLTQVVTNLLVNAAKYTEPGGEIDLAAYAASDTFVLRVRDNGRGIARDLLPHIFDMFQQGEGMCGGLGIGLALVKVLVELHGGSIAAFSAGPGAGSEFVVRLPRS
jgi:signal transduction histidine kinase